MPDSGMPSRSAGSPGCVPTGRAHWDPAPESGPPGTGRGRSRHPAVALALAVFLRPLCGSMTFSGPVFGPVLSAAILRCRCRCRCRCGLWARRSHGLRPPGPVYRREYGRRSAFRSPVLPVRAAATKGVWWVRRGLSAAGDRRSRTASPVFGRAGVLIALRSTGKAWIHDESRLERLECFGPIRPHPGLGVRRFMLPRRDCCPGGRPQKGMRSSAESRSPYIGGGSKIGTR
jgi:hypothetical protein